MTEKPWEERLAIIYEMMNEMSRQTDPQAMVRAYRERISEIFPTARRISLSRRELTAPEFRITRYSEWEEEVNPWTQKDRLPLLSGGFFADLLYSNQPQIVDDLSIPADDPAALYLEGQRSLLAIPMLDGGEALNMVLMTQTRPFGFDRERLPDMFWQANLFGRATHNLVLKEQVKSAFETIDRELKVVSQIQRSLLPKTMPEIEGLQLAAYYRTSQRAGGDYYDFFPLTEHLWGLFIADVSGHGTPAAVMMAITHSIAHLFPGESGSPRELLTFVNQQLCRRYTADIEAFVTAFYGIYDTRQRTLTYSSAGHNPPRLWKCREQRIIELDQARGFPLGVFAEGDYPDEILTLDPGDRLVLYTDGITEAMSPTGEQFGSQRLDRLLYQSCRQGSDDLQTAILQALAEHTHHAPPVDDQTLVVGTVS